MKKLILLLTVVLLCLLASPAAVAAQDEGVIEGQVMSGTADAPPDSVGGLEVALYQVTDGSTQLVTTAISDQDGRFRFDELSTDEDKTYRIELEYQGIVYGADGAFPPGDTVLHVVATIHETTSSDDSITVDRHHLILDFASDAVILRELYIFNNVGDRIYVGEDGATLRFSLPENAADVFFADSEEAADFEVTQEGLGFIERVPPGETQILYSYSVPYDGRELTLRRETLYPTANLDLLVANLGVQVEATQLAYDGLMTAGDDTYLHFVATDFPQDTPIEVRLSGAPQGLAAPPSVESSTMVALREAAPAITVGLALLGALLPFVQLRLAKRRPDVGTPADIPEPEAPGGTDVETDAQREELLRLIADLDDAYAEGLLNEEAYRQLSDKMRKRLSDSSMD